MNEQEILEKLEAILDEFSAAQGWNEETQRTFLLRFLAIQTSAGRPEYWLKRFSKFLNDIQEIENAVDDA